MPNSWMAINLGHPHTIAEQDATRLMHALNQQTAACHLEVLFRVVKPYVALCQLHYEDGGPRHWQGYT